ncbi:EF-hand domain-containing protein [Nocardiopsis potens]|uniref:EF-hand domain-containing protein n=1 Tax=Nocardiopsis potens TaxID=1246458 RepID=UPI0003480221|nr:EF-hand domain-containing protein [Nocardiopsis potens]
MPNGKEKARFEKRFELWDKNGDGVVDRSDMEQETQRVVQALGQQNSPKGKRFIDAYLEMWDGITQAVGKNRISKDDFIRLSDESILSLGDSEFTQRARPVVEALAAVLDTDGDGQISEPEFRKWLQAIGMSEADPTDVFEQLDRDGSGYLSVDEFADAVQDYVFGRQNAPLLGVG